jgi:uncharacterized short protein YbdD (DUF466 family)
MMRNFLRQIKTNLRQFWIGLRQWSGDAAYDLYVESTIRNSAGKPLSESEFYVQQLERKYSRPNRCC